MHIFHLCIICTLILMRLFVVYSYKRRNQLKWFQHSLITLFFNIWLMMSNLLSCHVNERLELVLPFFSDTYYRWDDVTRQTYFHLVYKYPGFWLLKLRFYSFQSMTSKLIISRRWITGLFKKDWNNDMQLQWQFSSSQEQFRITMHCREIKENGIWLRYDETTKNL